MRRKTVEERRTLSSLSLEMDASGRLKPMVKLYFESPRKDQIIWDIMRNNLDGKQDNLGHKAILFQNCIMSRLSRSQLLCPDCSKKEQKPVWQRDAWGRFVSPGKSKRKEEEMSNGNANGTNATLPAEGTRLPMSERLTRQSQAVQQLLGTVLVKGRHYGVVNAGDKPTLLKAGAEKLALGFGLAPEFEGERMPVDLGEGHREYIIVCRLRSLSSGLVVCSGLGSCSTRESRLQARFSMEGNNPGACLADVYNVVLKQAKKRALVDAVLTATAASDLFTQDLEDLSSVVEVAKAVNATKPAVPLKATPGSTTPSPSPATASPATASPATASRK